MIENKYSRWYQAIIDRAQSRIKPDCHVEFHHIIPRCAGGTDDSHNLVPLTLREHFICHLLLAKMYDGDIKWKLIWAIHRMAFSGTYYSRNYELARIMHKENVRQSNAHIEDRDKWKSSIKESFDTPGRREINSATMVNSWRSGKLSAEQSRINGRKSATVVNSTWAVVEYNGITYYGFKSFEKETGITQYDYQKYYMNNLEIPPRPPKVCPHCNIEASAANMRRWHGDNCKKRNIN